MHITVWPPSLIHIWPLVGGQNDRETPDLVGAGGGEETGRSKQVGESGREREREGNSLPRAQREQWKEGKNKSESLAGCLLFEEEEEVEEAEMAVWLRGAGLQA